MGWGKMEKADSRMKKNSLRRALLLPGSKHTAGQPVYHHSCLEQDKVLTELMGSYKPFPGFPSPSKDCIRHFKTSLLP